MGDKHSVSVPPDSEFCPHVARVRELEAQRDEWKRIAEEYRADRQGERKRGDDAIKQRDEARYLLALAIDSMTEAAGRLDGLGLFAHGATLLRTASRLRLKP